MFRFPLIVCVSLICGITAKPYKPWNKLTGEAFQDTVMSFDGKGKLPLWVQVEPPENMDETEYEIDHSMMIWKSMKGSGQDKQPLKAEEDLDELDHPSVVDLLKVQIQNLDANMYHRDVPASPVESELLSHELESENGVRVHLEPEEDMDDLYHKDVEASPVASELLSHELEGENGVRVHLEPEEDMDDLYHKDVQEAPYRDDTEAAAHAYMPSQRRHTAPEADLDDLWH